MVLKYISRTFKTSTTSFSCIGIAQSARFPGIELRKNKNVLIFVFSFYFLTQMFHQGRHNVAKIFGADDFCVSEQPSFVSCFVSSFLNESEHNVLKYDFRQVKWRRGLLYKQQLRRKGGWHSTAVAFALPTQPARVRFPAFPNFFRGKI